MLYLTVLTGVFGMVWYVIWLMVVYDSPAAHPTISAEEKSLIQHTAIDLSKVNNCANRLSSSDVTDVAWSHWVQSQQVAALSFA